MKYFNYLNLDFESTQSRIIEIFKKSRFVNFWNNININDIPESYKMFEPLNIRPTRAAILISYGLDRIHIDDTEKQYRINIPILNCEYSQTKFYSMTQPTRKATNANGITFHYIDPKSCYEVASFCLNKPAILAVRQPHALVVDKKKIPRVSCTFDFDIDISHLLNH